MNHKLNEKPPVFTNPPIVEVVCGVTFDSLKSLLAPHLGLFWERCFSTYPECREAIPLVAQIESREEGTQPASEFLEISPLPRIQLLNASGDGMIQIQRERFHYNWQKQENAEYPRFEVVFSFFEETLLKFQEFLKHSGLGELSCKQYELTYVNHIPIGDGWNSTSDIGVVFPDLGWRRTARRLEPETVTWKCSFWLPGDIGRLHAAIRTATRTLDGRRVLALELTARGMVGGPDMDGKLEWFNKAHDHIVGAFEDLASAELQERLWGRVK